MKKFFALLTCFAFYCATVTGQERVSATVASGENLNDVLSSSRYLFPEFQDARAIVNSGTFQVKMNYNALTDEMNFINDQGELLSLDKNEVRAVFFGDRMFRYTPHGYVEVLSNRSLDSDLLVQRKFRQVSSKKQGAYGTYSETTSISSYSSISTDAGQKSLTVLEDVTYRRDNLFFIFDLGKYYVANKSGFKKVFGKQRPDMENYIKNNPVNFTKEQDVIRLFKYCTE